MSPNLKLLISASANAQVSSASTERSFSAMNFIKSKLRNKMDLPLLNSIMNIRLNGVKPKHFNPKKYTAAFIEEHGRCDVPNKGQRKQTIEKNLDTDEHQDKKDKSLLGLSVLF